MRLTINGQTLELDPSPGAMLFEILRNRLAISGTKLGCTRGECGVCTVLLDGRPVYSCLTFAEACDGSSVVTVEGLAAPGQLSAIQRAFIAHDAAQCGFCTPGQLLAAHALLESNPHPSDEQIREAMNGNLCRCGTYPKILAAIRAVAAGEHGMPEAAHAP